MSIDMRSPNERRAAALLDTEERRTAEAQLNLLGVQKAAAAGVLDGLEAEWKRRVAPHEARKAGIRRGIKSLEIVEGEVCDAIIAINRELAPGLKAAMAEHTEAYDNHYKARCAFQARWQQ